MMADVIRAMGSKAILRGIGFVSIVGITVTLIGVTYMLLNNIEVSTITDIIAEFDIGKELINLLLNSIK